MADEVQRKTQDDEQQKLKDAVLRLKKQNRKLKKEVEMQQEGTAAGEKPPARSPARDAQNNAENRPPAPMLTRATSTGSFAINAAAKSARYLRQTLAEDQHRMRTNAVKRSEYYALQAEKQIELLQRQKTADSQRQITQMKTFIRKQVEERLDAYPPHFARLITVIQALLMGLMMYYGPIAKWGFGTNVQDFSISKLDGTTQTLSVTRPDNPYYGPEFETLVKWGSKWSPCMRKDDQVDVQNNAITTEETNYGCCENSNTNECGQMAQTGTSSNGGCTFTGAVQHGVGARCPENDANNCTIVLRPCCFGIVGQCGVYTLDHCQALGGIWLDENAPNSDGYGYKNDDGNPVQTCAEADCIFHQCGMGYKFYDEKPFDDEAPLQFYRFLSAVYLHIGVVHWGMNALAQYVLVAQIEEVAGFWRTMLMYSITGTLGFMISALFSVNLLSNGSSAAIYGMLGVETVDLMQTWQILDDQYGQLFWLLVKLILFLGIGTLPYIDNFAHVGGFTAGIAAGLCLLPYMVFSSFDEMKKLIMKAFSACVVIIGTCILLGIYYTSGSIVCSWCHYVNCVPYTDTMCESNSDVNEDQSTTKMLSDGVERIYTSLLHGRYDDVQY